jgi:hypothetical protein
MVLSEPAVRQIIGKSIETVGRTVKIDPFLTVTVGSRTGAPTLGSGGCSTAFAVALNPAAIITFPAPATSNVACGFPALRSPVCFGLWLMGPIRPSRLSAEQNVCLLHLSQPRQPSPQRISSGSGLANNRARLSVRPCLPYSQKNYKQQGRFAPRALPRFIATSGPSDSLSPSARFPGVPGYTAYLAPPISQRDEEGLSSCSARPCHHAVDNHPAGVFQRISPFALVHIAFTVDVVGSASEAESFEATTRSLALRPGDSPSPFR